MLITCAPLADKRWSEGGQSTTLVSCVKQNLCTFRSTHIMEIQLDANLNCRASHSHDEHTPYRTVPHCTVPYAKHSGNERERVLCILSAAWKYAMNIEEPHLTMDNGSQTMNCLCDNWLIRSTSSDTRQRQRQRQLLFYVWLEASITQIWIVSQTTSISTSIFNAWKYATRLFVALSN